MDFIRVGCSHSQTLSSYVGTVFIPACCCPPLLTTQSVLTPEPSCQWKDGSMSADKHSQVTMKQT